MKRLPDESPDEEEVEKKSDPPGYLHPFSSDVGEHHRAESPYQQTSPASNWFTGGNLSAELS